MLELIVVKLIVFDHVLFCSFASLTCQKMLVQQSNIRLYMEEWTNKDVRGWSKKYFPDNMDMVKSLVIFI
jgi:hypothetical protein